MGKNDKAPDLFLRGRGDVGGDDQRDAVLSVRRVRRSTNAEIAAIAKARTASHTLSHHAPIGRASDDMSSVTLMLPEPPSMNIMLNLAMKRTRKGSRGGWMNEAKPGGVYHFEHRAYAEHCTALRRKARIQLPAKPWKQWEMTAATFRLFNLRDPFELMAGLKWVVDWLVETQFVTNDSPREVPSMPLPTQSIERKARGVTITIRPIIL